MKIIIQCCSEKNGRMWTSSEFGVQKVKFVAHPDYCEERRSFINCRPDDHIPRDPITWRQYLITYNQSGENPDGLLKAGDLYKHPIYRMLVNKFGWENTFILSAGWGLVRSDFLLPYYDITFSSKADDCKKRKKGDIFHDFNHLTQNSETDQEDQIYFFGGIDYLPLFYQLTTNHRGRKVVYHKALKIPRQEGYEYFQYSTRRSTNWHYSCAEDFIKGNLDQ